MRVIAVAVFVAVCLGSVADAKALHRLSSSIKAKVPDPRPVLKLVPYVNQLENGHWGAHVPQYTYTSDGFPEETGHYFTEEFSTEAEATRFLQDMIGANKPHHQTTEETKAYEADRAKGGGGETANGNLVNTLNHQAAFGNNGVYRGGYDGEYGGPPSAANGGQPNA